MRPLLAPWIRLKKEGYQKRRISQERKAAAVGDAVGAFNAKLRSSKKFQPEEIFKAALENVKKDYPAEPKSQTEGYTRLRVKETDWSKVKPGSKPESLNDEAPQNDQDFPKHVFTKDIETAYERVTNNLIETWGTADLSDEEILKNFVTFAVVKNTNISHMSNSPNYMKNNFNAFLNLAYFKEGQKQGLEALIAKIQKAIKAEKEFYPAYAFYHARPASFAILYDITSEMRRIAQGSPALQAWRLEIPTEEDWELLLKKDKEAQKDSKKFVETLGKMGMAPLKDIEPKFTDCFSFAGVGFAYDDSAMVLFIQGNSVNQEEEALDGVLKKVLNIEDSDGDLISLIQEAQQVSIQKMGRRMYQVLVHPQSVKDLAWMSGTNPKKVLFFKDDQEAEIENVLQDLRQEEPQAFLSTYSVNRQSQKQKLSDYSNEGFLTLGLGLRFEKDVQNRLRSHHPALYDPAQTLIKQYYSLDPSEEDQAKYHQLIRKIAILLLEKHLQEKAKAANVHLDGTEKDPSRLQKALKYLEFLENKKEEKISEGFTHYKKAEKGFNYTITVNNEKKEHIDNPMIKEKVSVLLEGFADKQEGTYEVKDINTSLKVEIQKDSKPCKSITINKPGQDKTGIGDTQTITIKDLNDCADLKSRIKYFRWKEFGHPLFPIPKARS